MTHALLRLHIWLDNLALSAAPAEAVAVTGRDADHRRPARDVGQATTEYALVMLGAAVIALLVVTWATAGGGAGKIGQLFDRVIDAVAGKI